MYVCACVCVYIYVCMYVQLLFYPPGLIQRGSPTLNSGFQIIKPSIRKGEIIHQQQANCKQSPLPPPLATVTSGWYFLYPHV